MATADDLRRVLDERVAQAPAPAHRLAQVHARVTARRRRTVASAVGAVVTVVGLGAVVPQLVQPDRTGSGPASPGAPSTSPTASTPASPPEYSGGGRLLTTVRLDDRTRRATLRFTPTDPRLTLAQTCVEDQPDVAVRILVDGRVWSTSSGCGASSGQSGTAAQQAAAWRALGVELGRPAEVTAELAHWPTSGSGGPQDLPASARVAAEVDVTVYQRVPAADYPLPPRPAQLADLDEHGRPPYLADNRRTGAGTAVELPVVVGTELQAHTVAPGQLRFSVAGRELALSETWTWRHSTYGLSLTAEALRAAGVPAETGRTVRLRVEPSRFIDPAWLVQAADDEPVTVE